MSKVIRKLITVGAIYCIAELSWTLGKGYTLGLLNKYDISADEAIDMSSKDSRLNLKFIAWVANNLVNRKD